MASREFAVLRALFMDVIFSVSAALLYWLGRLPVWKLFFAHAASWLAAALFYFSSDDGFWLGSLAILVGTLVSCVDAFALLNTVCYLDGVRCCEPGVTTSPFTLGYQACGLGGVVAWQPAVWAAVVAVALGALSTGVGAFGVRTTQRAASVELAMAAVYAVLKVYVLLWPGVTYGAFFFIQTVVTVVANVAALFVGFYNKLLSAFLFLVVILIDVLTLLGSGGAVVVDTQSATGTPTTFSKSTFRTTAGGAVPAPIVYVWVAVHFLALALAVLEMVGLLVRNNNAQADRLTGPFDWSKRIAGNVADKTDDDDDGADDADAASGQGTTLGSARMRRKTLAV